MRVRLLGPVGLEVDGAPVSVGGRQAQAVLGVLAVLAGEVVTADRVIDEIWGERPPRSARVALQSYVSRLRGLHEPATASLLPRRPRGYLLDPAAAEIDARRYCELAARCHGEVRAGHWHAAREGLRVAAGLWRGTPFTGIDDVPLLLTERLRLETVRLDTRFAELDAVLQTDGPAGVIAPLRELVDGHPWDESGWRLLVLALYRAGRQAEALAEAAKARRLLAEEHGLDPSPELADLERRILVHDPTLEPTAAPVRLRGRLARPAVPLVGREHELTALLDAWSGVVRDRRAGLVVVRGEPGVGKSHLVARMADDVAAAGGRVLVGRCLDEPRLPLQPWTDLLPVVETAAPALVEGHPMVDVWEVAAHRLFTAVTDAVGAALGAGPALLVAEDVHWAGATALRLLDHVLACCADQPLLVVATVRSTGADMTPDTRGALGELAARTGARAVRLEGLDPEPLRVMLAEHGQRISAAEAAAVWARTAGVPLLAVEALRGGHDVLTARLARVEPAADELAELMAAIGDAQPFALLRTASGMAEPDMESALRALVAAGLVREAPGETIGYEFSHALYREALDDRLSDARRLLLARRVLAAADELPGLVLPSARAQHALVVARSGVPDDIALARDVCGLAGGWATRLHEHSDAAHWYRKAGELARRLGKDDDLVLGELELAHGIACRRAGLPHARDVLLHAAELARRAGGHRLLARVGLAWSRGFFSQVGQVDAEFVAVLREALHPPSQLPPALRARTTVALAAELTWAPDGDGRFALADTALDLARAAGDPSTLAAVLAARHLTVAAADTLDTRRRDAEELLDLAVGLDDVGLRFEALFHRCGPAIDDGDIALVERLLAEAGEVADRLRQPALQWSIGWSRASLLLWQGALPAAEKLALESAERGAAAGHPAEASMFLGGQLLEIRRLQGRIDELAPMLEAVPTGTRNAFAIARYLLAAGRTDAAAAHLDTAGVLRDGRLLLRRDLLERPSLDDLALLAARLGRRELAEAVRVRLEPLADTFGHGVAAHAVGHHWLGVLALASARPGDAVAHLRSAVTRHAELSLPLMEAESYLELASAYTATGEAAAASEARVAARRIARAHGAAGLVDKEDR